MVNTETMDTWVFRSSDRTPVTPELDLELDLVVDAQQNGQGRLHQVKLLKRQSRQGATGHSRSSDRDQHVPGYLLRHAMEAHVTNQLKAVRLRLRGARQWRRNSRRALHDKLEVGELVNLEHASRAAQRGAQSRGAAHRGRYRSAALGWPGQVLADVILSGAVPVVRLTEVFRQADQSQMLVSAH